jgi:hypothetical protein
VDLVGELDEGVQVRLWLRETAGAIAARFAASG